MPGPIEPLRSQASCGKGLVILITGLALACSDSAVGPVEFRATPEVVTGEHHACYLGPTGQVWCWGSNREGQLGDPALDPSVVAQSGSPVKVSGDVEFTTIAAGGFHTCGLDPDGVAYCWGAGAMGQLGIGPTPVCLRANGTEFPCALTPMPVSGNHTFVGIGAGYGSTCGLTRAGAVYCWGLNFRAQLGATSGELCGTRECATRPLRAAAGYTFTELWVGFWHVCGRDASGGLRCWGDNQLAEFGDGTVAAAGVLAPAPGVDGISVRTMAPGSGHSCALDDDQRAWCWGTENTTGALGTGTKDGSMVPAPVAPVLAAGRAWTHIAVSGANNRLGHSCGLDDTGAAYCWGAGDRGQLGGFASASCVFVTSRYACSLEPTAVQTTVTFVRLALGNGFSCGITAEPWIYCWGRNDRGQLGTATLDMCFALDAGPDVPCSRTPIRVSDPTVSAGSATASFSTVTPEDATVRQTPAR